MIRDLTKCGWERGLTIGERNVYGKKVLWVETIGRAVVRSGVIECKDELVVLSNSDC